MVLLVSDGLGFNLLPDKPFYRAVAYQFEHRPWGGAVFYDLIMPACLFMVGVAMPFAIGRRLDKGETHRQVFRHVGVRCLRLILISEICVSIAEQRAQIQFHNVLTQVAVTYLICFFLMQLKFWQQGLTAFLLLAGHSALYLLFPGPDGAFAQATNVGARIDRAIMGFNYVWPCVNINFLSETPGVLFGIWTGNLLRSSRPRTEQLKKLALGMLAAFTTGLLLSPIVPINKWLWTASYTLYTTGWAILGLLAFIFFVDYAHIRKPLFPLVAVSMNSLFVYCLDMLLRGWINQSLTIFTGGFKCIGTFAPIAQSFSVLMVIWLVALWMYRRRIFVGV
jgi:predicted acyltransferase